MGLLGLGCGLGDLFLTFGTVGALALQSACGASSAVSTCCTDLCWDACPVLPGQPARPELPDVHKFVPGLSTLFGACRHAATAGGLYVGGLYATLQVVFGIPLAPKTVCSGCLLPCAHSFDPLLGGGGKGGSRATNRQQAQRDDIAALSAALASLAAKVDKLQALVSSGLSSVAASLTIPSLIKVFPQCLLRLPLGIRSHHCAVVLGPSVANSKVARLPLMRLCAPRCGVFWPKTPPTPLCPTPGLPVRGPTLPKLQNSAKASCCPFLVPGCLD